MMKNKFLGTVTSVLVVLLVSSLIIPATLVVTAHPPENDNIKMKHGNPFELVKSKIKNKRINPIEPGTHFHIGRYSGTIVDDGIETLSYNKATIIEHATLGKFIRGWTFDNFLYVMFEKGSITINNEVLTLIIRNATVTLNEDIIVKSAPGYSILIVDGMAFLTRHGGKLILENSSLMGTGIMVLQPLPKLKEKLIVHMNVKFEITDNGIENITVGDVSVASILFNPGMFIGSAGRLNEVYIWSNARAHVTTTPYGKVFDIIARNITVVPASSVEIKSVTPTIAMLVVENKTYGIVVGRLNVVDGKIQAENTLRAVIGSGLMERWFKERHRYHQVFKVNASGEFSGIYISGAIDNGTIVNYTVRGTTIAKEIDLTSLLGNGYAITRHGCALDIIAGDNRVKIIDAASGPIIIKAPNEGTIVITLPNENITFMNVTEDFIKYYVDNTPVIIKVYNGTIEILGNIITVELWNYSHVAIVSPPTDKAVAEAFVKVFDDGSMKASGESIRPNIKISTTVQGNKVIARVSGEGEGTLVDIEIDPSVNISPESIGDLKVTFDGAELQLTSLDKILEGAYGYALTFDGVSYHIIVPVPHFSEHTIEILLQSPSMSPPSGEETSETSQEESNNEEGTTTQGGYEISPMMIIAAVVIVLIAVIVGYAARH